MRGARSVVTELSRSNIRLVWTSVNGCRRACTIRTREIPRRRGGDTFPDLRGGESGMCPSINVNQPLNNDAPCKEDFIVLRREQSSRHNTAIPCPLSLSLSSRVLSATPSSHPRILHPVRHLPSIFPFVPLFLQNWMRFFIFLCPNTLSFFFSLPVSSFVSLSRWQRGLKGSRDRDTRSVSRRDSSLKAAEDACESCAGKQIGNR